MATGETHEVTLIPHGGRRTRALALAAVLVAASCGSAGPPPSLVAPLGTNDFGQYALLVYDDSGLVTGGRALHQGPGRHLSGVVAFPERQELEIGWTGGACAHRPTLRLSGTSASLRLVISNPTEPQLPFVGCPAVGIPFAITLSLAEPVAQDAVVLEVSD